MRIQPTHFRVLRGPGHGQWLVEVYDHAAKPIGLATANRKPLVFETDFQADLYARTTLKLARSLDQ